jgi:hypothetical protein
VSHAGIGAKPMRLDELIGQLESIISSDANHLYGYEVTVNLDGNNFSIERVEPESDGVIIILET